MVNRSSSLYTFLRWSAASSLACSSSLVRFVVFTFFWRAFGIFLFPPLLSSKLTSNAIPPRELGLSTMLSSFTLSCLSSSGACSGGWGLCRRWGRGGRPDNGRRAVIPPSLPIWLGLYGGWMYTPWMARSGVAVSGTCKWIQSHHMI